MSEEFANFIIYEWPRAVIFFAVIIVCLIIVTDDLRKMNNKK